MDFVKAIRLDLSNAKFVSEETFEKRISRLRPEPQDILYSREGGILGIACQIPQNTELCLEQRMMLLRAESRLEPKLLMHWLNSPAIFLDRVQSSIQGAASPHVNVGEVKRFPMPVIPIAEQVELLKLVDIALVGTGDTLSLLEISVDTLSQLDQSILSKAFRGELVPQDPNDEPAADLLARIRATREAAKPKEKKTRKKKAKKRASGK